MEQANSRAVPDLKATHPFGDDKKVRPTAKPEVLATEEPDGQEP